MTAAVRRRQSLVAWLFVLPFVAVFGVFMLVPLLSSVLMSLTDFRSSDVATPWAVNFVGLEQYTRLFADPVFRRALLNTAYFVLVGIPLTMAVALVLALALNTGITRFRAVFRVGFYTPVVTSVVAVAVVWRFILQPDGLVNRVLGGGPDWLHSSTWAMPALIVMAAWRNMGTLMVIFLAGLQALPVEVGEAAIADGATSWQRFRHVTMPLLRPTLLLGAVLISVGYLQFFEEPFVMTEGGPLNSTLSATYFTYNQFGFGRYGAAAAASYVLFAAIAAVSFLQFRLLRAKD
jgi:multiple sugar transport system permease protein